jgi:hypothetical protein
VITTTDSAEDRSRSKLNIGLADDTLCSHNSSMAAQHFKIVIGCDEPLVVRSIKGMLASSFEYGSTFDFTESRQFDDFVQKATMGDYALAIMYPNCLCADKSNSRLEHALLAIKTIKAAYRVSLIVLTSKEQWLGPLLSAGADVCLQTPLTAKQLVDAISSFLEIRP